MELQHAIKLLSENRILDKIDIVDSPAYHELIRIPALRGVGYFMEQMQEACLDLEESGLEASLWKAKMLLLDIEKAIEHEERVYPQQGGQRSLNGKAFFRQRKSGLPKRIGKKCL